MSDFAGVMLRRLRYHLSPQWDIYKHIAPRLAGMSHVLDVGCGTGFGALQLTPFAKEVWALDVDEEAVKFARDCMGNVKVIHADITIVPIIPDGWDAVLMVEVLEHIEDYNRALRTVRDLLVDGGKLYVTARNANADLRRNDLHLREWTAREFKAALSEHFGDVRLFDYTLEVEQAGDTRMTPLVAVCQK